MAQSRPKLTKLASHSSKLQPSLREKEIITLSSLDFIEKKENVIFLGPPGGGRVHLSVALGIKACMAKYRLYQWDKLPA